MELLSILALAGILGHASAQNSTNFNTTLNSTFSTTGPRNVRIDTGTYGPEVEEMHYYYDQWPIGLAIFFTGTNLYLLYSRHIRVYFGRGCELNH